MGWVTEESRFNSGRGIILVRLYSIRHSGWLWCLPKGFYSTG